MFDFSFIHISIFLDFSIHRFNIIIPSLVLSLVYYRGVAVRQRLIFAQLCHVRPMDYIVGMCGCF